MSKQVPHFASFEEFWPYYVHEHSKKSTRILHFLGTAAAIGTLGYAIAKRKPKLLALVPVIGYGPAWIAHFFIEKNRPATFHYPLYSLLGDLRMFQKMVTGTMDAEVERVMNAVWPWQSPSAENAPEPRKSADPSATEGQHDFN